MGDMQGMYASGLAVGEWYENVSTRPLSEWERILEHVIDIVRVRCRVRAVLKFAWQGGADAACTGMPHASRGRRRPRPQSRLCCCILQIPVSSGLYSFKAVYGTLYPHPSATCKLGRLFRLGFLLLCASSPKPVTPWMYWNIFDMNSHDLFENYDIGRGGPPANPGRSFSTGSSPSEGDAALSRTSLAEDDGERKGAQLTQDEDVLKVSNTRSECTLLPPPAGLAYTLEPVPVLSHSCACVSSAHARPSTTSAQAAPLFAPPSPPPSVTPRLYPWASLSSAPPVTSSPLTNRGARISVTHIVMPALIPAYRVAQARRVLLLRSLLARTPLCSQLLLPSSTNAKYARSAPEVLSVMRPWDGSSGPLEAPVSARQRRYCW